MVSFFFVALLFSFCFDTECVNDHGKVLELDSLSFEKAISSPGGALIKFYAPWCSYCHQFEAPYAEAAHNLADEFSNLIVAQIDGTRFPAETTSAGVKGYPTVLLFHSNKSYPFNGERSAKDVISFVHRCLSPPVETLANEQALAKKVEELFDEVLFLYIGSESGDLWNAFNVTAEEYRLQLPFYRYDEGMTSVVFGEVFVYKDGGRKQFKPYHEVDSLQQLKNFIDENRNPAFRHIAAYDLRRMPADQTTVACVFLVDYHSDFTKAFKSIGRDFAFRSAKGLSNTSHFKFSWSVDFRGFSSLAMTALQPPNFFIYYPNNQTFTLHPLYSDPVAISALDKRQIAAFLEDATNGRLPRYGGSGWLISIGRFGFDLYSACLNLIQVSPVLALVTFGIPLACLSCFVYCICCSSFDALDDAEYDLSAAGEATRARLRDRDFAEAQFDRTTYEDASRARSIYNRFAEKSPFLMDDQPRSKPPSSESRKDR